jgi:hypothetical protein
MVVLSSMCANENIWIRKSILPECKMQRLIRYDGLWLIFVVLHLIHGDCQVLYGGSLHAMEVTGKIIYL